MKTWRRKGIAKPRAVLSVAFDTADFDVVDRAAEASGVFTSTFVRQAALDRARLVLGSFQPANAVPAAHTVTTTSGHLR